MIAELDTAPMDAVEAEAIRRAGIRWRSMELVASVLVDWDFLVALMRREIEAERQKLGAQSQ